MDQNCSEDYWNLTSIQLAETMWVDTNFGEKLKGKQDRVVALELKSVLGLVLVLVLDLVDPVHSGHSEHSVAVWKDIVVVRSVCDDGVYSCTNIVAGCSRIELLGRSRSPFDD